MSIAIMAGVLEARGHNVTVIDPVEKLLAVGHYLESTVDIAESTRRIAASRIPADHMVLMAGFTAGNEKGELVVLGRNGSDYSAAVLPVYAPIVARSGRTLTGSIPATRVRCPMRGC